MTTSRSDGNGAATGAEPVAAPLLEQHLRLLEASAIHPDVVRERGYFSASARKTLQQLGFSTSQQKRVPALVIPVCGVTGAVVFHQARPDQPRDLAGKPVKYETPHGARMALDVHPLARRRLGDPTDALIVTEGIRKADAAFSQGVTAIALMGVWNWRGTNGDGGKAALADWELVALNDRGVFLCFDSDATAKREVRAALERLQGFLELRGATVHVAELEPGPGGAKVGLDDFLAGGGDLAELLNRARSSTRKFVSGRPTAYEAAGNEFSSGGELPFTPLAPLIENVPPEPPWTVRGYLSPGSVTLLAGRPKAGKSTFAFALIAAVARGETFVGATTTTCGVLLLTEERHDTIAEKARALSLTNSFPAASTPIAGNEFVHVLMRHDAGSVPWPEVVRQAMTYCAQHKLGALIVDTFDRWSGLRGDAENAAGAVNEALEPLQYAAAANLAVLLISHQRKSSGEFGEAVRGSSALTGGVDVVVELERPSRALQLGSQARVLKAVSRFASTPDELYVELEEHGFQAIESPEQVKTDAERARVLDALEKRDEPVTSDQIGDDLDIPKRAVRRYLSDLLEKGLVRRSGAGKKNDPYVWHGGEEAALTPAGIGAAREPGRGPHPQRPGRARL
jgi:DNA-binding transcriptional ArsR family regulator